MEELTELQESCLNIVVSFLGQNSGKPPTRRELMNLLNQKSINGVNQILAALGKKGYIKIEPPGKRRNIVVLKKYSKQLSLFGRESRVHRP